MTSAMPRNPASRLWLRNCSPRVAEICSLDSSWIGNGSEPNLRTVTSSFASAAGKPPRPPPVIWPWPFGIGPSIDGAEIDPLVERDRELLADVLGRVLGEQLAARLRSVVLELEVDRQAVVLVLAHGRRGDLVAAEQRRILIARRAPGRRSPCVRAERARSRAGRSVPTRRRTASTSETPGSSMTTRSAALTTTTGSDTPVVFTRRSMMSLMTPIASGVGDTPSLGRAWYSTRRPPSRSSPSLVSTSRHWPSAAEASGRRRSGRSR